MEKQSFKGMSAAVLIGLALSVILIACSCAIPRAIIGSLYEDCSGKIASALNHVKEGNNTEAYSIIKDIDEMIEGSRNALLLFYDHKDILELSGSARTALMLAETEDTAQLIVELRDIERAFYSLIHMNDMSIYNIF